MNSTNYILTENGVISKLDTYWDKLKIITEDLENLTRNLAKWLFYSFIASMFLIVFIFWLDLDKSVSLVVLSMITLAAISFSISQLISYLEFSELKKKGRILHDELSNELEYGPENSLEEISVEERIILSNFQLACELPINPFIYLGLLVLLPLVNIVFSVIYYIYL